MCTGVQESQNKSVRLMRFNYYFHMTDVSVLLQRSISQINGIIALNVSSHHSRGVRCSSVVESGRFITRHFSDTQKLSGFS